MKTRHVIGSLMVLLLIFGACREITVRTTVHDDGSFTRTIIIRGDSSDVFKKDLPYPVDTTWAMEVKQDTADSAKLVVTYTREFQNNDDLMAEIQGDTSWMKQIPRHTEIRKRFGFFYSRLVYKEVYSSANPFKELSYKDFLTPEEYLWITRQKPVQSPADSVKRKDAEDKVFQYLEKSATAEAEKILADGIARLNDPALDPKEVGKYHDSIHAALNRWDKTDSLLFIDKLSKWSGNPAYLRLNELKPPLFEEFRQHVEFLTDILGMEEFHVEAELPGVITKTNSNILAGNKISWDVFPMAFLLEDYTMSAESRIVNTWAFILTGLVLLGLVALLVYKNLKK